MIYIKVNPDGSVVLGGTVANEQMLKEGWVKYDGEIPNVGSYEKLVMVDGVLTKTLGPEKVNELLEQIKLAYEQANQEDIEYMGTVFQADSYSQDLIAKVLAAGSVPDGFFWLDKYNNKVPMTYEDLQGLAQAILFRNQQNFVKYQTLKNKIKQATTQEELEAIKW